MRIGRTIRRVWAWRIVKWPVITLLLLLTMSCAPVAYIELACRGDAATAPATRQPLVADPAFHRREANTFLTYPEWHIVYAYDGLAETLKRGDEHGFDYVPSIFRFWRSTCALMRVADAHGGADLDTRVMIHTIGVSFTVEMVLKGAYEETVGRFAAWWRGDTKTPQDQAIVTMATDYSAFLRQTPWYAYPFTREIGRLWAPPAGRSVRSWERRLAIGTEFGIKAVYGKLLGGAVAATAPAQLTIHSVIGGLDAGIPESIPDVRMVAKRPGGIEIDTPRYDRFTRLLVDIAKRGGQILEIAGNETIMVTLTVPSAADPRVTDGRVILRMPRDGIAGDRVIVEVPVKELAAFLNAHPVGDPGVEHVFDY